MGSSSKSSKKTDPVNTLRPRDSFCLLLVSSHFFYPIFKRPIPSQKWILKQQVRVPLNNPKHSEKSPAHVRTPSVISPEPLPKRPENPSRATAVVVGHVHRGLRRDQLLDHGGMAFLSRAVQPRQASVPGMRGGRWGSCSCRRQTKHSYGMFLRVVGQSFFDIGHRQKICHPILLVCGIGEKQEQSSQISHVTCVFTRDLTSSCNIPSQHHEWLV